LRPPPRSTLCPYTTLFRSRRSVTVCAEGAQTEKLQLSPARLAPSIVDMALLRVRVVTYVEKDSITLRMHRQNKPELVLASSSPRDRKSTRLNSSHLVISYA